jgi:hypothetical protein
MHNWEKATARTLYWQDHAKFSEQGKLKVTSEKFMVDPFKLHLNQPGATKTANTAPVHTEKFIPQSGASAAAASTKSNAAIPPEMRNVVNNKSEPKLRWGRWGIPVGCVIVGMLVGQSMVSYPGASRTAVRR